MFLECSHTLSPLRQSWTVSENSFTTSSCSVTTWSLARTSGLRTQDPLSDLTSQRLSYTVIRGAPPRSWLSAFLPGTTPSTTPQGQLREWPTGPAGASGPGLISAHRNAPRTKHLQVRASSSRDTAGHKDSLDRAASAGPGPRWPLHACLAGAWQCPGSAAQRPPAPAPKSSDLGPWLWALNECSAGDGTASSETGTCLWGFRGPRGLQGTILGGNPKP